MNEEYIDLVYDLLCGTRIRQENDPNVENLFAAGQRCEYLYEQVYNANMRICERLGVQGEDADVETIINALLEIGSLVGKKMYRYGAELEEK